MEFKKIDNKDYAIRKIKMKTNAILAPNLIEPLNSITCGSLIIINGGPNSGKTNLLINLLSNRKKNGKAQSFRGCFHNIFLCSPTLHTINDDENIFADMDEDFVFDEFNDDFLEFFFNTIEEQKDDDEMSLIEPDEEPPDTSNIYSSDKVFIGSGVEAGAWAAALAARGASDGALIVTDQPRGTAPYDRSSLTNTLIDPTMEAARSFNNIPFCTLQVFFLTIPISKQL